MEMTKQVEPTDEKPAVTRRFIACTQSTGRVGKSTVAEGLITWLRFAGVEFAAVDADSQHQTLSRRYPEYVETFDATKTFDDFARMVQALPNLPVILVDFPAQATDFLLSAATHFRLLKFFGAAGIRPRCSFSLRTIQLRRNLRPTRSNSLATPPTICSLRFPPSTKATSSDERHSAPG
jgi:hypothetical protein